MTDDPLVPEESPEAVPFWEATREGRLLIQRCQACGSHQFYPRALCRQCGSRELGWVEAAGGGTIHTHTTVMRSPHPSFEAPYVVALVDLDEGPRLLTHVLGVAHCDARVTLAWHPLPDGRQLPVFRPEP